MTSHSQDDGFHEIQLNGKQLVFLFMAATVVSVVIFLCGVLVGRGVRSERDDGADTALTEPAPSELPATETARVSTPSEPPSDAPPAVEDLSYFNRLDNADAPPEQLKAPTGTGTSASLPVEAPPAAAPAPPTAHEAAASPAANIVRSPAAAPAVRDFAVQIAALNARSEADAMAKRLSSKGYSAFVLSPADGTPSVYRVRVGPFKTRREADTIAAKLQKEEQFKPWVTR